ncbi:MADS-box transcription factor 1-like [Vigna radiata var. radiata]|uniref:MADS-box transcription factor 1-like n=1 Tax=Vigna radiata var. radiata TaxID=3916 RepID=A0A3Q0ELS6_VIGRR|nr:MADS-box transcription factor 1-like [Vigna radiata var. radiata]
MELKRIENKINRCRACSHHLLHYRKVVQVLQHFKELSSQQEYLKLKARYEALQRFQRNLMGEDLGPLSSNELESLERQLDSSLKQIRSTRTQFMLDQLSDSQRKEHLLGEANTALRQRWEEYQINQFQLNPSGEDIHYTAAES